VFTDAEALELLARRIGAARLAAEPGVAKELMGLCARLPLALAITAARASARPGFALATLAAELRDARSRLDVLTTGEQATDVRTVLSWSYHGLKAPAARMFRLLGLHPGPDITAPPLPALPLSPLARRAGFYANSPAATCSPNPRPAATPCTTCSAPTLPSKPTQRKASPTGALPFTGCSTTTCTPPTPPAARCTRPAT
jgi:hypothetical protein